MSDVIEKLTTNTYRTLKTMYDSQITLPDGTQYVPISQAELSRIIGVSTITMNSIFKYLKEKNLVSKYENKKGKYILTDNGLAIVHSMEKLSEKLQ